MNFYFLLFTEEKMKEERQKYKLKRFKFPIDLIGSSIKYSRGVITKKDELYLSIFIS